MKKKYEKHLKKLTEQLVPFTKLLKRNLSMDSIEMRTEKGTNIVFGLFKNKNVAIGKAFGSKGTVLGEHVHKEEDEWLGCYEGIVQITFAGKKPVILKQYDTIMIPKGVPHHTLFLKDTWLWYATMPAAPGFPTGLNFS